MALFKAVSYWETVKNHGRGWASTHQVQGTGAAIVRCAIIGGLRYLTDYDRFDYTFSGRVDVSIVRGGACVSAVVCYYDVVPTNYSGLSIWRWRLRGGKYELGAASRISCRGLTVSRLHADRSGFRHFWY